ncbi:uncharacterized protein PSANT_01976 [Moesziomyces antarcticus]|uniref:Uncharacterized protein n=1 Tax=Pseudozyma antarctica TaxID=84753 RepID=A0A5C3FLA0_PSEA2|nr:uncharacterized protein PSANT_01976 [Moesziomyces antarcticus]
MPKDKAHMVGLSDRGCRNRDKWQDSSLKGEARIATAVMRRGKQRSASERRKEQLCQARWHPPLERGRSSMSQDSLSENLAGYQTGT